ncbi:MAG: tetratricopeptide repeat protein [Halioglobus sp.]|nr:tetratricopeptide repeat protein [Halioglobus sp.]
MSEDKPTSPADYVQLAKVARTEHAWPRCIELWELCFSEFPTLEKAFWYAHHGSALLQLGDIEKAQSVFEQCTARFPDNAEGYTGLARVATQRENWDQALVHWEACFQLFPDQEKPFWQNQKSMILARQQKVDVAQDGNKQSGGVLDLSVPPDRKPRPTNGFRYVFIITYGRSGSTLLQGILNSIEGVVVRGENGNIFFDLYRSYQKLVTLKSSKRDALQPNRAWYGINFFDESALMRQLQEVGKVILSVDEADGGSTVYGFKEIRYNEVGDDLNGYLNFLARLFPDSAFVFNTRNLGEVSRSAWWKNAHSTDGIAVLQALEQRFEQYAKDNSNCFSICYEDVVSQGPRLLELFKFLEASYDADLVSAVLRTKHSYNPEQAHIKELFAR